MFWLTLGSGRSVSFFAYVDDFCDVFFPSVNQKILSRMLSAALAVVSVVAVIGMFAQVARAVDKEKVLHNFGKGKDGALPEAGLIFDAAGNLYGTTLYGGNTLCGYDYGCGTVFRLTPTGNVADVDGPRRAHGLSDVSDPFALKTPFKGQ